MLVFRGYIGFGVSKSIGLNIKLFTSLFFKLV
jgi:hypothetical protein